VLVELLRFVSVNQLEVHVAPSVENRILVVDLDGRLALLVDPSGPIGAMDDEVPARDQLVDL